MKLSSIHIKEEAQRLGFFRCGLAPAGPVAAAYAAHYRQWLDAGCQAEMHYLENHFEKRMDPRLLVEGCRTIISVAMNYRPARVAEGIAWYAQGRDYHEVMKDRLQQLMQAIGAHGRCFVDTAPVPERYWAWRCGLGWIGKHTQLVIPRAGSCFFLGELFIEEEVDVHDTPMENRCGSCRKCVDACPGGAISPSPQPCPEGEGVVASAPGLDARRCLSYLTIEHRGELPPRSSALLCEASQVPSAGGVVGEATFYGCDRCLKACPHLQVEPTDEACFQPSEALLAMTPERWQQLTVEEYRTLFKGSAVKRAKYEGLMRNIKALGAK